MVIRHQNIQFDLICLPLMTFAGGDPAENRDVESAAAERDRGSL